jgi:hypothetical protein
MSSLCQCLDVITERSLLAITMPLPQEYKRSGSHTSILYKVATTRHSNNNLSRMKGTVRHACAETSAITSIYLD